jgi:ATP-dependent exoDNAse (exonuclease V) beta subunit
MTKDLEKSVFAKDYQTEMTNIAIDALNLLYVGFTRAEEVLFAGGVIDNDKSISSFINNCLSNTHAYSSLAGLAEYYQKEHSSFIMGNIPPKPPVAEDCSNRIQLTSFTAESLRDKTKFALHTELYLDHQSPESTNKREFGNMMHRILEQMDRPENLPLVIAQFSHENNLAAEESRSFQLKLERFFNKKEVADCFGDATSILNEPEILTGDGHIIRPDKIIFHNKHLTVIDYKFGEEHHEAYQRQVKQYMQVLQTLCKPEKISGYIWYIDKEKTEMVRL